MNNSRLIFIPPLLVSILLFTISNLKLGIFLNNTSSFLLFPLVNPVQKTQIELNKQLDLVKSLPEVNKKNREQKVLISHLVWENEVLKQAQKDTATQTLLQNSFREVLPIKVSSLTGKIIATSSLATGKVLAGMPVVSGNILLGIVTEVNNNTLNIISLEDDIFPSISLRSSSGPKGVFRHNNGTSQIINVPSQTPLILGDFVLSEATDLIPANLLVGKVTKLLTSPQDPIQKGEVTLYDTFQNTTDNIVVVLKP